MWVINNKRSNIVLNSSSILELWRVRYLFEGGRYFSN